MAARQAMEAQMPRRRSSSEASRSSPSAISRISNRIFSRSGGAHGGRRGFHRDGAIAERLGLESGGVQLVGDARVVDLLLGGELHDQRHQQALHLHAAGRALLHDLLEQDALVGHVLVDDPQAVAAGGDDEALVDLAQRAQVREHRERHFRRRDGVRRETRRARPGGARVCPRAEARA